MPGVSIAAVALQNGLNANILRRWVNEASVGKEEPFRLQVDSPILLPSGVRWRATAGIDHYGVQTFFLPNPAAFGARG